jgi:hypothetical protein
MFQVGCSIIADIRLKYRVVYINLNVPQCYLLLLCQSETAVELACNLISQPTTFKFIAHYDEGDKRIVYLFDFIIPKMI